MRYTYPSFELFSYLFRALAHELHLFWDQINVSVMLPFLKESKKHCLPPSFSLFKENENFSKLEEQLNYFFVINNLIY